MIQNPYEWRVLRETPTKRVLAKVDLASGELVICEEFLEDAVIDQAREQRERPMLVGPDLKPLGVIPASVESRAINEGWINDMGQWKRWLNDIDNNRLRTTDGVA